MKCIVSLVAYLIPWALGVFAVMSFLRMVKHERRK